MSPETINTTYPLGAARALALHAQGLAFPPDGKAKPDFEAIYSAIERVGWVQIDTLHVVQRSQYLTLWSRLGCYDTADFDRLLFDGGGLGASEPPAPTSENGRRLFEYWMHAACIIPLTDYRYRIPMMRRYRDARAGWRREWGLLPENAALMDSILEGIRANGLARPAQFEQDKGRKRGPWWDWNSAKIALEHLYNQGDLAIANRINFQRVYDIADRVLPDWVDRNEPTEAEASRHLLERSMRALGVCTPAQVGDYFHMKRNESRPFVEELIKDGTLVPLKARLGDDKTHNLVVHRDNLTLLEQAADGAIQPGHTTFLSPFDSLFWARDRDMQLWGFRQVLEAYKPEGTRQWGYFCMPILYKDKLVGRFDPKVERKTGTLRLKKLYLEAGVEPDEELAASLAEAMRDFMAFHKASDLLIEHSDLLDFGRKVMAALGKMI